MRRAVLIAVLLASTTVAGCSATVQGTGAATSAPGPANSAPFPDQPTGSTSPAAPAPSASADKCPVRAVTRRDAPFCYSLPTGFRNYSTLDNYGKGWQYRTLVSIGRRELIEVFGQRGADTDSLSYDALQRTRFDPDLWLRPKTYGLARIGAPRRLTVAGARAFEQRGAYTNGVVTDVVTIFQGAAIVDVTCQSLGRPVVVDRACAKVRDTLVITG